MAIASTSGSEGWSRLSAMMELAKAKNPSLTSATSVRVAEKTKSAEPAMRSLPSNSPMVMRTYGSSGLSGAAAQSAQATRVLGSRFDAYA